MKHLAIFAILALLASPTLQAKGSHSHRRSHTSSTSTHPHRYTEARARDSHGRIARSESAKRAFERQTGHPHGWPGHVVDHIVPLACGGADDPSNMRWQSKADAAAKDKLERRGCH